MVKWWDYAQSCDVIRFTGNEVGTGHDQEPLVQPSMKTVERTSWSAFEQHLLTVEPPSYLANVITTEMGWNTFLRQILEMNLAAGGPALSYLVDWFERNQYENHHPRPDLVEFRRRYGL
jgi:hypothetical protein